MGREFPPVQTGPRAHPASCTMGTGSLPGVKCGRGVLLTPHPLLMPWSWKNRVILLPTLWATTGPVTGTLYLLPFSTSRRYSVKRVGSQMPMKEMEFSNNLGASEEFVLLHGNKTNYGLNYVISGGLQQRFVY